MIHEFIHITGHISGARADHGHHVPVGFRPVGDRRVEPDLALVLFFEGGELGAAGAVGAAAEEPRFYYIC